jgi:hypothetical protein
MQFVERAYPFSWVERVRYSISTFRVNGVAEGATQGVYLALAARR